MVAGIGGQLDAAGTRERPGPVADFCAGSGPADYGSTSSGSTGPVELIRRLVQLPSTRTARRPSTVCPLILSCVPIPLNELLPAQ
ncbi:hypothetical protein VM98_34750, partial [Streptomyces rubellomurinus subsp. indigoferus]